MLKKIACRLVSISCSPVRMITKMSSHGARDYIRIQSKGPLDRKVLTNGEKVALACVGEMG